ncbi:MAG: SpoIID/LytB domain-containing protein [Candidatus Gastranaerophilales bacterium]|nr:SpoIID/LytB domain-containing protein [Candidatus Gastranaerophilales bacterium]
MFLNCQAVTAYDAETPIRVGISDSNFSTYNFNSVTFSSEEELQAVDSASGEVVKAIKEPITVKMEDGLFKIYKGKSLKRDKVKGPVVIKTNANSLISIKDLKRAGKPASYRGIIELVQIASKPDYFAIVNVLDLKNYLKGVVPNEMPVYFGLEALKAQCVAARNYALRPRSKFYNEFDICDSVACQVYFGAKTEKELSNRAVDETDGLVALYDGDLILALYSSTAGGYTESHANAFSDTNTKKFPGNDVPYLKAQPDIPDMKSLADEKDAREFYTSKPDTYDNLSPYFRWTKEWTLSEFIKMLNTTMYEQRAFVKPSFTENDRFTKLHEVKIKQRGDSGKVMFLEIITEKGTYTIYKELTIRRLFKKDGKALPSANFVCDVVKDNATTEPKIVFHGGGYGHGVGMSQYGAGTMAQSGLNFMSILKHYYTGIAIGTMPVILTSKYGNTSCSQTFYAPLKRADIVIDEINGISDLSVVINGVEVNFDLGKFIKKNKIDISKYIKRGSNYIEYNILSDYAGQKSLKLHVEIKGSKDG